MRIFLLASVAALALCACGPDLREELDQSLHAYGNMFRWNNLDAAGVFSSNHLRPDFNARIKAAKNARVVDYRMVGERFDKEKRKASVDVEIDYYLLSSASVRTLRDTEEWVFITEKDIKGWRLMSLLPEFR